uniref:BZIP domain-containing protein n=1 Tax=Caenorhabditis japonica TaxID=281687 RepID=A0A8R1HRQ1_CAEJA
MTDFQQQLQAAGGLCNPESLKAFGQMYAQPGAYGNGFLRDEKYNPMLPFFQHFAPYATTGTSSFSPTSSTSTSSSASAHQSAKKKPVPVPVEQKDESYYERRRRNNEAARKSREQRRKQDSSNEVLVRQLTEENASLKLYIHQLMTENTRMQQQIYAQAASLNIGADPAANLNIPTF